MSFFNELERLAEKACGTVNGYAFADCPHGMIRVNYSNGERSDKPAGIAYYLNQLPITRADLEGRAVDWAPSWLSLEAVMVGDEPEERVAA